MIVCQDLYEDPQHPELQKLVAQIIGPGQTIAGSLLMELISEVARDTAIRRGNLLRTWLKSYKDRPISDQLIYITKKELGI